MADVSAGRSGNETVVAFGHDSKKFRLRAVSAEKEAYSKFINKPFARKVSLAQFILALLTTGTQIITIGMVTGRYSYYDSAAGSGAGIWGPFFSAFAALQTIWCLKETRYWKLHLSFALHIISTLAAIFLVILELGGNIPTIRYKIGEALYSDDDETNPSSYYRYGYYDSEYNGTAYAPSRHRYYYYNDKISVPMMTASLILNSFMATTGMGQLVLSFLMSLMTGRAICCGQSKVHGKVFALEMDGSENKDGVVVVKKGLQAKGSVSQELRAVSDTPPTYQEAQVV